MGNATFSNNTAQAVDNLEEFTNTMSLGGLGEVHSVSVVVVKSDGSTSVHQFGIDFNDPASHKVAFAAFMRQLSNESVYG